MNPDQYTPVDQSDLGPYCLQYRSPKYKSRRVVVNGGKGINYIYCSAHWKHLNGKLAMIGKNI